MAAGTERMNLTHHFLIAMPAMADPHFARSLTYICEHNDQGALGIVVNRPLEMSLQTLLEQVSIPLESPAFKAIPIHFGGPVQVDRGFVLHTPLGQWQSTLGVGSDIGLTTSKDILQAAARGEGPRQLLITLGYAGWAPGQLEEEIKAKSWFLIPADKELIFDKKTEQKWQRAMDKRQIRL